MPTNTAPSDLPIHSFTSANDFESFLDREHADSRGIYLKLAKKSAGIPSISVDEALEVGLCFGWINGQGKPFNDEWYLSRFVPRRPKSLWSKRNVDLVAKLVEAGRMRPAGVAAVEAAKADGRWDRAYAGPATMDIPDDFATALAQNSAAAAVFEGLNKTGRYQVLLRVHTATPQSRSKRIETLISTLADGKVPGVPTVPAKAKTKAVKGRKARTAVSPDYLDVQAYVLDREFCGVAGENTFFVIPYSDENFEVEKAVGDYLQLKSLRA
ncbi:MAG: hypothetical protein M1822_002959 [Bathelium mastoideum]|nr:MAG: hypothetical protein M1822_002959 [Bathelium mastoideum]